MESKEENVTSWRSSVRKSIALEFTIEKNEGFTETEQEYESIIITTQGF